MRGRNQKLKQRRKRPATAARKTAQPKLAAPLNTARDAKRTRDLKKQTRQSLRPLTNGAVLPSPINAAMDFVKARAAASLEFPRRLAKCRSPIEAWREQARFMQEGITDYARYLAVFSHPQEKARHEVANG
jgi:hypothetical protein